MKKSIAVIVFVLSWFVVLGYGWVLNLMFLIDLETFVFSEKVIVSIIGVFVPPVGAIMGLFIV